MNKLTRQGLRSYVSTLSLLLFPVTLYYFSPVLPLSGAAQGILTGSLIVFLLLVPLSLFTGRFFCSWICPAGVIQDMAGKIRKKPFPLRLGWIKYIIWGSWLMLFFYLIRSAGGVRGVDIFYMTNSGFSVTDKYGLIIYTLIVLIFFTFPLLFGRRAACHCICWMAPFMDLGQQLGRVFRLPRLRIRPAGGECISCGKCAAFCPMSLPIDKMSARGKPDSPSCILCGHCVDVCPVQALRFGIEGDS